MTIATNLAGVGDAGEFPCGETRLGYDLLLESGAFRMSQREQRDAPLDQDEQQNIFIALSLP